MDLLENCIALPKATMAKTLPEQHKGGAAPQTDIAARCADLLLSLANSSSANAKSKMSRSSCKCSALVDCVATVPFVCKIHFNAICAALFPCASPMDLQSSS